MQPIKDMPAQYRQKFNEAIRQFDSYKLNEQKSVRKAINNLYVTVVKKGPLFMVLLALFCLTACVEENAGPTPDEREIAQLNEMLAGPTQNGKSWKLVGVTRYRYDFPTAAVLLDEVHACELDNIYTFSQPEKTVSTSTGTIACSDAEHTTIQGGAWQIQSRGAGQGFSIGIDDTSFVNGESLFHEFGTQEVRIVGITENTLVLVTPIEWYASQQPIRYENYYSFATVE